MSDMLKKRIQNKRPRTYREGRSKSVSDTFAKTYCHKNNQCSTQAYNMCNDEIQQTCVNNKYFVLLNKSVTFNVGILTMLYMWNLTTKANIFILCFLQISGPIFFKEQHVNFDIHLDYFGDYRITKTCHLLTSHISKYKSHWRHLHLTNIVHCTLNWAFVCSHDTQIVFLKSSTNLL